MVSIHAPTRGATAFDGDHAAVNEGVSIHAPTRGATGVSCTFARIGNVSIHAPTRGATVAFISPDSSRVFQSTRPHGARRFPHQITIWMSCFNPRAHTGRDAMQFESSAQCSCFNPRAHTGRDACLFENSRFVDFVSIHAPTRGATVDHALWPLGVNVSIHAPTRGATKTGWRRKRHKKCFNPRAHTGRDKTVRAALAQRTVSIHAPTRGATRFFWNEPISLDVSIHAPTRGATPLSVHWWRLPLVSIHAPTRGATAG